MSTQSSNRINVYVEAGKKKVFAGAIDWPGWCRSGRDEESALQALFDAGARYARALRASRLGFKASTDVSAFAVIEQLEGNATTDFGAPGIAPSVDEDPVNPEELKRLQKILRACWRTFDAAVKNATGESLRVGPRGGGRQLEGIIQHVLDSNAGYLNAVGWKLQKSDGTNLEDQFGQVQQATLRALTASARGEIPTKGPRGGSRWSPRYFVRRVAWHILDHAWEIEDRIL
jgi:hypothetical protein